MRRISSRAMACSARVTNPAREAAQRHGGRSAPAFPAFPAHRHVAERRSLGFRDLHGDSGGPVLSGGFGGKVIVGVVYGRESFGDARSCGTIGQAVRVAPQAGWIAQNLARWSGEARPRPTR